MKNFKSTFIGLIMFSVAFFGIAYVSRAAFYSSNTSYNNTSSQSDIIAHDNIEINEIDTSYNETVNQNDIILETLRIDIIAELDSYIDKIAPKNKIASDILFDLCIQYNIDVRFVVAQGQIESHFATKGTAKKTNSIFNVGAYDGHSAERQNNNGFGFNDPNESIEPYLILLTNDYLVDGKTEFDLMDNYVNYIGKRYASNKQYEKMLKSVYNRINTSTNLDILLKEYNEIKIV